MSNISRADRFARSSHVSRQVHRNNSSHVRVTQGIVEPELMRAARLALKVPGRAFTSSLWRLKERLDAGLRCGDRLSKEEQSLHQKLSTYFAA